MHKKRSSTVSSRRRVLLATYTLTLLSTGAFVRPAAAGIWERLGLHATDIGVNTNWDTWGIVGSTTNSSDHRVAKYNWNTRTWQYDTSFPSSFQRPYRIDVCDDGRVVVGGGAGGTGPAAVRGVSGGWSIIGAGTNVRDVGCGGGTIWAVSNTARVGGYWVLRWTGTSWEWFSSGGAVRITADQNGRGYIVNNAGVPQRWTGSAWVALAMPENKGVWDLSAGAADTLVVTAGYKIYRTDIYGGNSVNWIAATNYPGGVWGPIAALSWGQFIAVFSNIGPWVHASD